MANQSSPPPSDWLPQHFGQYQVAAVEAKPPKRRKKWPWITAAAIVGLAVIGNLMPDGAEPAAATAVAPITVTTPAPQRILSTSQLPPVTSAAPAVTSIAPAPVVQPITTEPVISQIAPPTSIAPQPTYVQKEPTTAAPAPPPVAAAAAPFVDSPSAASAYYANCAAAKAAGAAPIYTGQPGYSSKLDRDGDGVACE